eukprot:14743656-Alexandrium_andersonii.AAC.1
MRLLQATATGSEAVPGPAQPRPPTAWAPLSPGVACENPLVRLLRAGLARLESRASSCEMARHAPGPNRRAP